MHYSDSHEWVKITNSTATVGVSQYAQKELGDIVHIELPKVGVQIKRGQEMAVLESTKAAADVYAPVSGEIAEINTQLQDHPELINESPEDKGWLIRINLGDPTEMESLMDETTYEGFVNK
ncbi:MAG: Glycine cleavage system H protein [Chlamydiae bacterium]|nr:Glycine cleavage system H protein [Chlamydiota bacterium]